MPSQLIKDKGKVFRDPVHRLIRIEKQDQFVLDLINTPEFQRLRRVRQLGVSSLTYHGAEHSRFVHSLGVFNFAQRIIAALQRRYAPDSAVSRHLATHARTAKAAALLHDLGHGPFSHMIERASVAPFHHEAMTTKLITDERGNVKPVLDANGIDPTAVASVIDTTFPSRLIVDVVSSQLDADRMDYLLRDSLMTGVEYGVYDAEWLLNSMCVGRDPTSEDGVPSERYWRLCLDRDRGQYAAEQLILARHHMMLQVYMHRVTRGYEVMLLMLFKEAARLLQRGAAPTGTPEAVSRYFQRGLEMEPGEWLLFDEAAMVAAFQAWSRTTSNEWERVRRLVLAYLNRERLFSGFSLTGLKRQRLLQLQKGLEDAGVKKSLDWELDDGEHLPYKGVSYVASKGDAEEGISALSILLGDGNPDHRGVSIEAVSEIMKQMDNQSHLLDRLYVDHSRLADAKPALIAANLLDGEIA